MVFYRADNDFGMVGNALSPGVKGGITTLATTLGCKSSKGIGYDAARGRLMSYSLKSRLAVLIAVLLVSGAQTRKRPAMLPRSISTRAPTARRSWSFGARGSATLTPRWHHPSPAAGAGVRKKYGTVPVWRNLSEAVLQRALARRRARATQRRCDRNKWSRVDALARGPSRNFQPACGELARVRRSGIAMVSDRVNLSSSATTRKVKREDIPATYEGFLIEMEGKLAIRALTRMARCPDQILGRAARHGFFRKLATLKPSCARAMCAGATGGSGEIP
jgi:hypothetical protein